MKTYKLIAICIASLFFGACSDGLDEAVSVEKRAANTNIANAKRLILHRSSRLC